MPLNYTFNFKCVLTFLPTFFADVFADFFPERPLSPIYLVSAVGLTNIAD